MSYDVSAFYVTETHLKNRLKTDVKPGGGILSGGNGPGYQTNDRTPWQLRRDPTDKRLLCIRHPPSNAFGQPFGPAPRLRSQPLHLRRRTRQPGRSKPHAFLHQFAHDVERLMPLLGW